MFIKLAQALAAQSQPGQTYVESDVFEFHPLQLTGFLETAWECSRTSFRILGAPPIQGLGSSATMKDALLNAQNLSIRTGGGPLNKEVLQKVLNSWVCAPPGLPEQPQAARDTQDKLPRFWHHLIYAYAIENTRIYEIFQRVLQQAFSDEVFGTFSVSGQRWLRTTEALFYKDTFDSMAGAVTSFVRPDIRAVRRNAYYRMFGMDLNHGTTDNRPYPYDKATSANRDFVSTLESFLKEVWKGYINVRNVMGPASTDENLISELANRLKNMMNERRGGGNLSREEFIAVATMSWFHLTVSVPKSPILMDLKADSTTPEDALRRIADRVGMPVHSKSRDFFRMASPLSRLLSEIEMGTFDDPTQVPRLYDDARPNHFKDDVLTVINHWSEATGHNLKAVSVTTR